MVMAFKETFERSVVINRVPESFSGFSWMRNVFRGLANEMGQRGRSRNFKTRPRYRDVNIKVGNDMIGNPFRKIFTPFGAPNKTILSKENLLIEAIIEIRSELTSSASQLAMITTNVIVRG
jgi:hypothetical protein